MKIEFQVPLLPQLLPTYLLPFSIYAASVKKKKRICLTQVFIVVYKKNSNHYLDESLTLHAVNDRMVSDRKELIT